MLTEKQNLRYDLLKANSYEVAAAKACYEFITGPDDQAPAKQQTSGTGVVDIIPDGVYLVMADDKNTAVLYRPGMQLMVEEVTRCIGIGVKQGDRSPKLPFSHSLQLTVYVGLNSTTPVWAVQVLSP